MADYWISRDKYFCKYCKIFIADDKPSRLHHDTGFRHKGNYERYIRDIYKRGARDAKDKVEEAKEIARIDAAAKAAMGIEPDSEEPPVASTSKTPAPPAPAKPADPYANYTTAESLGYKDDAEEKKREEAELRQKEGTIGQWQKVAKRPPPPPPAAIQPIPTGGFLPVGSAPPAARVKREEGGALPVKAEHEEDEKPKLPEPSQPPERRTGYFTEKRFDADDDEFDPAKIGGINLKRKRLTLKEEEELEAQRVAREEASVPLATETRRTNEGGSNWVSAEIKEEPMLEFEDKKPETENEDKVDVKPDTAQSEAKAGGGTGFKKRKMHGAGTVRKK
ncbi:hypothetical protein JCM16303_003228 [Sporobolomyces ruberrimus]